MNHYAITIIAKEESGTTTGYLVMDNKGYASFDEEFTKEVLFVEADKDRLEGALNILIEHVDNKQLSGPCRVHDSIGRLFPMFFKDPGCCVSGQLELKLVKITGLFNMAGPDIKRSVLLQVSEVIGEDPLQIIHSDKIHW